jgi:hypothetical protein
MAADNSTPFRCQAEGLNGRLAVRIELCVTLEIVRATTELFRTILEQIEHERTRTQDTIRSR